MHQWLSGSFLSARPLMTITLTVLLRGAVERHLEIIGEAARNVSADFQSKHPQIPWIKIIAQRHVLAHEYGEVKHERIWLVATVHISELIKLLKPLIPEPPEQDF